MISHDNYMLICYLTKQRSYFNNLILNIIIKYEKYIGFIFIYLLNIYVKLCLQLVFSITMYFHIYVFSLLYKNECDMSMIFIFFGDMNIIT